MMHAFGEYGIGMGAFGMVFMVFFWVLIIVVIVYFVKMIMDKGKTGEIMESPEDILKKRYARGEISKEEFESMNKNLSA